MADEHAAQNDDDPQEHVKASEDHTRTVTDLIDELRRDAFSRSLSKRLATRRPAHGPE